MEVYKILVVGEPHVGKSSLITSFFNCDQLTDTTSHVATFTKNLGA